MCDVVDRRMRVADVGEPRKPALHRHLYAQVLTAILLGAAQVLAERREKLAGTVKFLFQPAEVLPDDTGVTIRNRRLFETLDDLMLAWSTELNGEVMDSGLATLPPQLCMLSNTTAFACCTSSFTGTKRMLGRWAASQIASASALSFFCRFTYGLT